jgi:hypothetical protein
VCIHYVTDIVEQLFVLCLVRLVFIISVLAHHSFFKRKMGGNAREYLAEEIADRVSISVHAKRFVQLVDEINELTVLMVDVSYAGFELLAPLNKTHRVLPLTSE